MSVFLTSAYPYDAQNNFGPQWLLEHADDAGRALCTDDPEAAQCILFVENHPPADPYFLAVRRHELFRKYPDKCVLYHDADRSVTAMRTISPSIERWQYDPRHKRTAHYIARLCENDGVNAVSTVDHGAGRHLYSFQGAASTHPVRAALLAMPHPDDTHLEDTSGRHAWLMSPQDKCDYERRYVAVTLASDFVLCPRGIGPATYRQFEVMQLGRAPVIISDDWVEIPGPDWNRCSIRIREADIARIPVVLRERRHEAAAIGRAAKAAWENHFSPSASLATVARSALELADTQYSLLNAAADLAQFRDPWHARNLVRYARNYLRAHRQARR